MEHYDLLNQILADACPTERDDITGVSVFQIESHCVGWKITARLTSVPMTFPITYEIISAESFDV